MKLIIIFGPPAVGKMAVGRELTELTKLKLFHNHMSIEFALNFFEYGTPKFHKLNSFLRRKVFEEVATSELEGLIFTFVWDLNMEKEKQYVDNISDLFRNEGGSVYFVELEADLEERLKRNRGASRIREKPSKTDLELSEERLLSMEKKHVMNTNGMFFYQENYLKINNTTISAKQTAELIKKEFDL